MFPFRLTTARQKQTIAEVTARKTRAGAPCVLQTSLLSNVMVISYSVYAASDARPMVQLVSQAFSLDDPPAVAMGLTAARNDLSQPGCTPAAWLLERESPGWPA
jgi:hypothetical protein